MNCYVHSDKEAAAACVGCGKFICESCLTEVGGKSYCKSCVNNLVQRQNQFLGDERNRVLAALLAFFLGSFGIHKFYLGQKSTGIAYLIFFWTGIPGIIAFFEGIKLILMTDSDFAAMYGT